MLVQAYLDHGKMFCLVLMPPCDWADVLRTDVMAFCLYWPGSPGALIAGTWAAMQYMGSEYVSPSRHHPIST
jgi:hypothetical protein